MRALSVIQPWAQFIAIGVKRYETRGWAPRVKGRIAIHASKSHDKVMCRRDGVCDLLERHGFSGDPYPKDDLKPLPLGAIVAMATIVSCEDTLTLRKRWNDEGWPEDARQEMRLGDFSYGRYGWLLEDVVILPEPVPCKGALNLWTVPDDVVAAIAAQGVE